MGKVKELLEPYPTPQDWGDEDYQYQQYLEQIKSEQYASQNNQNTPPVNEQ